MFEMMIQTQCQAASVTHADCEQKAKTKLCLFFQAEKNVAEEEMFRSQLLPDHRARHCECAPMSKSPAG